MWLGRSVGLVTAMGVTLTVGWSCSSSTHRDINYGTDVGAGYEALPKEAGTDAPDADATANAPMDADAADASADADASDPADADTALDNSDDMVQNRDSETGID